MEVREVESFPSQDVKKRDPLLRRLTGFVVRKKFLILSFFLLMVFIPSGIYIWKNTRVEPVLLSPLAEGKILATSTSSFQPNEVIGFLPYWMIAKKAKVYPERLTQLVYFGLGVSEEGELIRYDENKVALPEWTYFKSRYFSKLRKQGEKTGLKILMAITCFDNATINKVISNSSNRQNLIDNLDDLIDEHDLDGVNVDFEFNPGGDFPSRDQFSLFLEELVAGLKKNKPDLVISIDINSYAAMYIYPYDLKNMSKVVDQVILMAYDFHRPNSTSAGPVAPIETDYKEYSIIKTLQAIFDKIPKERLILGVPFYGYEWQTTTDDFKSMAIPNTGSVATYSRVKDMLKEEDITVLWNQKAMSPWFVYEVNGAIKQVYYENESSLSRKLQLVKQLNLSGIAIWALGYEGRHMQLWEAIDDSLILNLPDLQ